SCGRRDRDTASGVVAAVSLGDEHASAGGRDIDPVLGKAEDVALLDDERLPTEESDSVESAANPVDPEVAYNHHVIRSGLDHNAVGSADQRGSHLAAAAVKGDGFGNRQGAKPSWIQGVDLSAWCGLGNSAGPRLARGCPAARVNVIPHT